MSPFPVVRRLTAGLAILAAGCSSNPMDTGFATQLVSVSPRGGAMGVTPTAVIVLVFSRSMMSGMEQYLALHQGGPVDPVTPMNCNWSDGRTTLTCRPGQPLARATRYTVHLGGGVMDGSGRHVGMERNGMAMGGRWAARETMGGQLGMMGSGWRHTNGSYGMVFEFDTE